MKKILIVEDDAVVSNIYRTRLQNEGYEVDAAFDGSEAIASIGVAPPNLVLLDLGLPKINGIEVLKAVRANPLTAALPVIVLSNSYVTAQVQAAWKAGATKCLSKADSTPRTVVDVVNGVFAAAVPLPAEPRPSAAPAPPPGAAAASSFHAVPSDAIFQSHVRLAILATAPTVLEDLRKRLKLLAQPTNPAAAPAGLFDFYCSVHSLASHAGAAGFSALAQLAAALEALLKELHDKPRKIGPSPVRTVAQAIDSLAALFEAARNAHEDRRRPLSILVLDDEVIARQTLCSALDRVNLSYLSVDDPLLALRLLPENRFDLIFSDVEMPSLSGFDFCSKVRALPNHKLTPLVFVTGLADFESRARSSLSGGTDLIAKPFLLSELAVKAFTYVLRNR